MAEREAGERRARMQSAKRTQDRNFSDPRREWRRVCAEAWGTFLLVLASAGGVAAHAAFPDKVSAGMAMTAPAVATTVVIYMLGDVSGAHINPEVTLAFALRGNFPWARAPGYLAAQLVGALAAALVVRWAFGPVDHLGANTPGPGVGDLTAAAVEALFTAGLITTILGSASGARNVGPNAAIAVGGYTIFAKFVGWPLSGASMNSFRSLAPDLVRGDLSHTWIYIAGPLVGAAAGVGLEWLIKGPPTSSGTRTAQGEGQAGSE